MKISTVRRKISRSAPPRDIYAEKPRMKGSAALLREEEGRTPRRDPKDGESCGTGVKRTRGFSKSCRLSLRRLTHCATAALGYHPFP